jgi:hypothetical protein
MKQFSKVRCWMVGHRLFEWSAWRFVCTRCGWKPWSDEEAQRRYDRMLEQRGIHYADGDVTA